MSTASEPGQSHNAARADDSDAPGFAPCPDSARGLKATPRVMISRRRLRSDSPARPSCCNPLGPGASFPESLALCDWRFGSVDRSVSWVPLVRTAESPKVPFTRLLVWLRSDSPPLIPPRAGGDLQPTEEACKDFVLLEDNGLRLPPPPSCSDPRARPAPPPQPGPSEAVPLDSEPSLERGGEVRSAPDRWRCSSGGTAPCPAAAEVGVAVTAQSTASECTRFNTPARGDSDGAEVSHCSRSAKMTLCVTVSALRVRGDPSASPSCCEPAGPDTSFPSKSLAWSAWSWG